MKKVGKYRLDCLLGKGAFGEVYKGADTVTGQPVAIKSISLRSLNAQLQKQLEAELNALKAVNSPYVVRLFDAIKTTNNVYIVMEFCGGGDLERFLARGKRVSEGLARRWLWNLLEAFICLHASGIIHRDIKLANILLSDSDPDISVVKLADFGFARFAEEQTLMETILGTPMFMAPEVLSGKAYSYKVDVWSLGVLAYEILVGREAFQVRTIEELKRAQAKGVQFPADCPLSEDAKSLLRALMVYDPAQRLSFEDIKKQPFFKASRTVQQVAPAAGPPQVAASVPAEGPEDYEIVEIDEPQPALTLDFSFIEETPMDLETIEDPEFIPPGPKPETVILCIDYQCELVTARVTLGLKYQEAGKVLIAFAVFLDCLNELEKCSSKLETLRGGEDVTAMKRKVAGKLTEVRGWVEQAQERLTSQDLMRSVMKYEDSGLRVDDRLLVQEAESLLHHSSAVQTSAREAQLLLTMACAANPENAHAAELLATATQQLRL